MGVGQNKATRGPQILVFGSIYQGSILGTYGGWTKSCTTHCLLVFTGDHIILGFLRWCRISSIHSMFDPQPHLAVEGHGKWFTLGGRASEQQPRAAGKWRGCGAAPHGVAHLQSSQGLAFSGSKWGAKSTPHLVRLNVNLACSKRIDLPKPAVVHLLVHFRRFQKVDLLNIYIYIYVSIYLFIYSFICFCPFLSRSFDHSIQTSSWPLGRLFVRRTR